MVENSVLYAIVENVILSAFALIRMYDDVT